MGAASLRQSERRLLATQAKPVMPTRKRKHFIGTNRGDALVGVPALGVGSMWPLPLGKKRELLGKLRVGVGGPTGSDGEDDADEDDEEVAAVKAPWPLHFTHGEYHDFVSQHTIRCGAT